VLFEVQAWYGGGVDAFTFNGEVVRWIGGVDEDIKELRLVPHLEMAVGQGTDVIGAEVVIEGMDNVTLKHLAGHRETSEISRPD